MKLGCVTLAYREERFIVPFIQAMQNRVGEILVLNSLTPWEGIKDEEDNTATVARSLGASVISFDWPNEAEQRNAGQDYFNDCDWVIVLDPDEYILDADWVELVRFLAKTSGDAFVCGMQHTYWKTGFVIDPPEDYKQIIAVKPYVRFIDKRVVDSPWAHAPVDLHHFSWARSDEECYRKISHYSHAHELDPDWFSNVWLSARTTDLHPLTPESLKEAVRVELPKELVGLNLWP